MLVVTTIVEEREERRQGTVFDVGEKQKTGGAVAVDDGAFAGEEEGGVGGRLHEGDQFAEDGAVARRGGIVAVVAVVAVVVVVVVVAAAADAAAVVVVVICQVSKGARHGD